ncbi:TIGR02530 family flagellar biosynthesis protein [Peribacillus loiseleuriae]|uniref:TIGR02530 family flagellar biosynthesis protein n=1 Tax=Peribacillus loiseleuriae TaxID=1679170 RepID=UPI00381128C3
MKTNGFRPISNLPTQPVSSKQPQNKNDKTGFSAHFQTAVHAHSNKLTISKHAQMRLDQRNIQIDKTTWTKIEEKIQEAKKMGITDSLVILEDAALVVSTKKNTVITAMERTESSSHIFTNINGTILLN